MNDRDEEANSVTSSRSALKLTGKPILAVALLCAVLYGCMVFLHPMRTLLFPYSVALFFQHHMAVYVRDHRSNPPRAFPLFANVAFAGVIFEYGFPLIAWYRFGLIQGVGLFVTAFVVVIAWSITVESFGSYRSGDLQMYVNFAGLLGMPLAVAVAIARVLQGMA